MIPLIKLGYWRDINRYYKVSSPLLEFYKGDDIEIFFVIEEHTDPGLDPEPRPFSIVDIDIELEINAASWPDEEPVLEYSTAESTIVKVNALKGYFKLSIPGEDSDTLEAGPHVFKMFFFDDDKQVRALQDFIEILI